MSLWVTSRHTGQVNLNPQARLHDATTSTTSHDVRACDVDSVYSTRTDVVVGGDEREQRRVGGPVLVDLRLVDALRERRPVVIDVDDVHRQVHVGRLTRRALVTCHDAQLK